MLGCLRDCVASSHAHRVVAKVLARRAPTVWQLPRVQHGGRIITVPDHPSTIEYQGLEPVLGELLSCPTTADPSADYNRIVRIAVHPCPSHESMVCRRLMPYRSHAGSRSRPVPPRVDSSARTDLPV